MRDLNLTKVLQWWLIGQLVVIGFIGGEEWKVDAGWRSRAFGTLFPLTMFVPHRDQRSFPPGSCIMCTSTNSKGAGFQIGLPQSVNVERSESGEDATPTEAKP